ncbi:MAG: Hsp70 family protein [Lentisphaerales bacterium]|nr:Hsp70 family protein [Lentisphaerales bacterium]
MSESRYIIGIDLGTTNSTVAYVDTQDETPNSQSFKIPQIIAPGEIEAAESLPSFLFLPEMSTLGPGSLNLPWNSEDADTAVGAYAKKVSSTQPGRVVSSAKSWLCSENVDRMSSILPAGSQDERKVSPVEACAEYLKHIAAAWNHAMASEDESLTINNQQVILTVPASFDAAARELTVLAAEEAGLNITLLEEPQAAFYNWLHEHEDSWRDKVEAGSSILVCDVGGGTTDFSLIGVEDKGGDLTLNRIAVGNHILLGGDNMDITLAYAIQQKLKTRLNPKQMAGLIHSCRQAKERLCSDPEAEVEKITVLGSGSSLIGGTLSSELTRDEINTLLLDGFTPECEFGAETNKDVRAGLRTFGLSYATDTALTRHLSEFLMKHALKNEDGSSKLPSAILFNGGVSKADLLRDRIYDVLNSWSEAETEVITGIDPDLAVARGAAWYGFVRRGNSIRIKSGSAHSYYIGIESSMPAVPGFPPPMDALCVVPFGTEDGSSFEVPMDNLGLIIGESCQFRFFSSTERQEDQLGILLDEFSLDGLNEMAPMTSILTDESGESGNIASVRLESELTEIGTLKLWFHEIDSDRRWRLEFNLGEESEDSEVEESE